MKKVILVLMVVWAAVAAQAYDYKPLVEPGKTWWYRIAMDYSDKIGTMGIRIGEQVELNGYNWNVLRFVEAENRTQMLPTILGYVRQDDSRVYFYPPLSQEDLSTENKDFKGVLVMTYQIAVDYESMPDEGWVLYDMAFEQGDSYDFFGVKCRVMENDNWIIKNQSYKCQINETRYEINSGIERKIEKNLINCPYPQTSMDGYIFIDGIGIEHLTLGGLFFVPIVSPYSCTELWRTSLQGVVDAQEELLWAANESITEPWELAGIADAVADGAVRERVSVYTPWGVCVRRDVQREESLSGLPAGVYIVTDGAETRKIAVR